MRIEEIFSDYQRFSKRFRCPACRKKVFLKRPASLVCQGGHCFDLSKHGYVNFLPNQKSAHYTKELFENRRAVFEGGYYEPLAESLGNILSEGWPGGRRGELPLRVLDAGCGEGYYDRFLCSRLKGAEFFAFDNAKEAVAMAAKAGRGVRWFVADLTNIPMQSETADAILDIFTPSNYSEFARVLGKEGRLIKVIPGEDYLRELRGLIWREREKSEYSAKPVTDYLDRRMKLENQLQLRYTRAVDPAMAERFVRMTPMMFGRSPASVDVQGLTSLTFAFTILIGKR